MSGTYDPNSEVTNTEKVVAAHWECLRRNKEFCALSARWLKSEEFRRSHALSSAYHDLQNHSPRCAWDWMLTAAQRTRLAKFQIQNLQWFFDDEFNFGPIICSKNCPPAKATKKNWLKFLRVKPLPNPPPPLTFEQSWNCASVPFKEQFRLTYAPKNEFGEINASLRGHGEFLAKAASRLAAGDPHNEASVIANYLFTLGSELRELAEFSKVFKIPKRCYSEKRFKSFQEQIRASFKTSNLLLPTATYDTHKSYLGTAEDWRWFIEAESLRLDIRKSPDVSKLAKLYSEELRQRTMRGKAPRRAKPHGHSGSKFPSRVIKNRRNTVRRHVQTIGSWIQAAYPPHSPEPSAAKI